MLLLFKSQLIDRPALAGQGAQKVVRSGALNVAVASGLRFVAGRTRSPSASRISQPTLQGQNP